MHRSTVVVALAALALVTAGGATATATAGQAATTPLRGGSIALSGAEARAFAVPPGMVRLWTADLAGGGTQTRYQQMVGAAGVLGGQLTVLTDSSGKTTAVVGAYFPGLKAKNRASVSTATARGVAAKRVGAAGTWSSSLRIDPKDGRLFHEVVSQRVANRWVQWVDAGSGAVKKQYDAVAHGDGIGVKGDKKTISTRRTGNTFVLRSRDGRQATYDAGNTTVLPGTLMTDRNDHWNFNLPGWASPSQAPGVDAHYYANVTDDFYRDTFRRNSLDDNGMTMLSSVHFDVGYCNAFWNGQQMVYGDGDGTTCLPLSGGLDVVSHELTHAVTQFTSNLIYENESGALNESFSDMMGNTAEFYAARRGLDRAASPDWLIGEDVVNAASAAPGFRDMGDPRVHDDPDHYSELLVGEEDSGLRAQQQRHLQPGLLSGRQRRQERRLRRGRVERAPAYGRLRRQGASGGVAAGGGHLLQRVHQPARVRELLRRPQCHRGGRGTQRRRDQRSLGSRGRPLRLHAWHAATSAVPE